MIGTLDSIPAERIRTRECAFCNGEFSYPIAKGNDRKYCGSRCREAAKQANRPARDTWSRCVCGSIARSPKATQCERCYCLERRKRARGLCLVRRCVAKADERGMCQHHAGRVGCWFDAEQELLHRYVSSHGYVEVVDRDHALADSLGRVREHRKVMYDHIGDGDQACYWCGDTIGWDKLHIDHLDENKQNNEISNLVVACRSCNSARGLIVNMVKRLRPEAMDTFMRLLPLS